MFWLATTRAVCLAVSLATAPLAMAAAPGTAAGPSAIEQALELYQRQDFAAAASAFERLSRVGVPAADYNLAVMHLRQELPQSSLPEAIRLMRRAADKGFVTAMVGLAQLHERGDVDGRRDLAGAHQWHLKAAQAGSVEAQLETATAFYLGRGAPKDMTAAAHWYREAAKRGDVGAQYLIASMYETGLGVERDLRLARYWYDLCARNGDVVAAAKLRALTPAPEATAPAAAASAP
ncbi:MAG: sel1 repeat family protein [Rubrivivax sp.]|nr:sel1 repeat family protein [Rubrivivax sp.]